MSNVKTKPAKKLTKSTTDSLINYGIVIVLYIIMMIMQATGNLSSSMKGFLVPVCIYVIMAVSLNLVVGILGELSLGHAGFMCVGAYTSAIFSKLTESTITAAPLRFTLAILVGAFFAAVFGILIGIPVLRLKGDYLAIVTLAFGEITSALTPTAGISPPRAPWSLVLRLTETSSSRALRVSRAHLRTQTSPWALSSFSLHCSSFRTLSSPETAVLSWR